MKTVISIDWDFFVPEDLSWDLAHMESKLFLKMLWSARPHLLDAMKTDGAEKSFWNTLTGHADIVGAEYIATDSHSYGYQMARGADHLVLFDTHHDLWPWNDGDDHVHCANWARFFMLSHPRAKLTWIRGEHSDYDLNGFDDFGDRVTALVYGVDPLPDFGTVETVHTCRSGCWTPPWLDQNFVDFVEAGAKAIGSPAECLMEDEDWNPLQCRWSDAEFEQARHLGEQMKTLTNGIGA